MRRFKMGYEDTSRGATTRRHSTRSYLRNESCSSWLKSLRTSVLLAREIQVKFSKDENLENGWGWKSFAMVVINTGTSIFEVNASKLRRPLNTADLEEFLDSWWTNRSTCLIAVLWGPNRCLGVVLGQLQFEFHTWSSRTHGRSPSKSESEEGWKLLTPGTARLLVEDENEELQSSWDVSNGFYLIH